jgi:hypothetical protein
MIVRVEIGRFLTVVSDPEERIVFDSEQKKYHLLRESAARLWDQVSNGGDYELEAADEAGPGEDAIALLIEAGLIRAVGEEPVVESARVSRRTWMRKTGQATAAALVLPLVATISTPGMVLGQRVRSTQSTLMSGDNWDPSPNGGGGSGGSGGSKGGGGSGGSKGGGGSGGSKGGGSGGSKGGGGSGGSKGGGGSGGSKGSGGGGW